MTGISYTVTIEAEAARKRLAELVDRMDNRAGFHKNVGEHLLNRLVDRFEAERAPDGSSWLALKPVTIAKREADGLIPITILRASGRLAGSFNALPSSDDVRIGSGLVYAAIHHFGGEAGRGHSVTIPARPILGLEPDDPDEIMAIAEEWLGE